MTPINEVMLTEKKKHERTHSLATVMMQSDITFNLEYLILLLLLLLLWRGFSSRFLAQFSIRVWVDSMNSLPKKLRCLTVTTAVCVLAFKMINHFHRWIHLFTQQIKFPQVQTKEEEKSTVAARNAIIVQFRWLIVMADDNTWMLYVWW